MIHTHFNMKFTENHTVSETISGSKVYTANLFQPVLEPITSDQTTPLQVYE